MALIAWEALEGDEEVAVKVRARSKVGVILTCSGVRLSCLSGYVIWQLPRPVTSVHLIKLVIDQSEADLPHAGGKRQLSVFIVIAMQMVCVNQLSAKERAEESEWEALSLELAFNV